MRHVLGALMLIAAPAVTQAAVPPAPPPLPPAGCVTDGLPAPQIKLVGGKYVFVRPIATVLDGAIDDFGQNAGSDALVVYCVSSTGKAARGNVAMCLTGEKCPWR